MDMNELGSKVLLDTVKKAFSGTKISYGYSICVCADHERIVTFHDAFVFSTLEKAKEKLEEAKANFPGESLEIVEKMIISMR